MEPENEKKYEEAIKYYLKAADLDYASAQFKVGYFYYHGQGVEQDYVKAVEYYKKAADQGHAEAQHNLDILYANGYVDP